MKKRAEERDYWTEYMRRSRDSRAAVVAATAATEHRQEEEEPRRSFEGERDRTRSLIPEVETGAKDQGAGTATATETRDEQKQRDAGARTKATRPSQNN